MIIHELGLTNASCHVMDMITSHRYAILSNHMGNFGQFKHGMNWGLCGIIKLVEGLTPDLRV